MLFLSEGKKMKRLKHKEDEFEIAFYEGVLKNRPDFIDALMALGDLYTRNGYYEKGLVVDRKLEVLCPDNPVVLYNLACSYSLLNKVDESFKTVQRAVDQGYADYDHMESDSDLDNLRRDDRFWKYYKTITEK